MYQERCVGFIRRMRPLSEPRIVWIRQIVLFCERHQIVCRTVRQFDGRIRCFTALFGVESSSHGVELCASVLNRAVRCHIVSQSTVWCILVCEVMFARVPRGRKSTHNQIHVNNNQERVHAFIVNNNTTYLSIIHTILHHVAICLF